MHNHWLSTLNVHCMDKVYTVYALLIYFYLFELTTCLHTLTLFLLETLIWSKLWKITSKLIENVSCQQYSFIFLGNAGTFVGFAGLSLILFERSLLYQDFLKHCYYKFFSIGRTCYNILGIFSRFLRVFMKSSIRYLVSDLEYFCVQEATKDRRSCKGQKKLQRTEEADNVRVKPRQLIIKVFVLSISGTRTPSDKYTQIYRIF